MRSSLGGGGGRNGGGRQVLLQHEPEKQQKTWEVPEGVGVDGVGKMFPFSSSSFSPLFYFAQDQKTAISRS